MWTGWRLKVLDQRMCAWSHARFLILAWLFRGGLYYTEVAIFLYWVDYIWRLQMKETEWDNPFRKLWKEKHYETKYTITVFSNLESTLQPCHTFLIMYSWSAIGWILGQQVIAPAFKGPQLYPPFLALVFIPSSFLYHIGHDEFNMSVYIEKWFGRHNSAPVFQNKYWLS